MNTLSRSMVFCFCLLVVMLMGGAGCSAMQDYLGGMDKPGVSLKSGRVESLGLEKAVMVFDVEISNPYPVALPLTDLSYGLSTEGKSFFTGKAAMAGVVEAKGKRVVSLPVEVGYAQAIGAGAGIRPGAVVPYVADLVMSLDTSAAIPGGGRMEFPMRKEGKVAIPIPPKVELTNVKWNGLSLNKAEAVLSLKVSNPNLFGIDVSKLETGVSLAGTRVGKVGTQSAMSLGEGGGAKAVELPMSFSPMDFGLAFFKMLGGASANYELDYTMAGQTPGGPLLLSNKSKGTTGMK
jgi:LEA14-like dessication related protein